ncbi:hypothetical protein P20652_1682 [Pseudoalteromonas sp. BSi20652]|nr:hypothetical protein P20652_1682 [Pseudoalteromonas sp. BSi20652]
MPAEKQHEYGFKTQFAKNYRNMQTIKRKTALWSIKIIGAYLA